MKRHLIILSVLFASFVLMTSAPPTKADETTIWEVDWYEVLTDTGTFGSYLGTEYWFSEFDQAWPAGLFGETALYGGRTNETGFKATTSVYVPSSRYVTFTVGSDDGYKFYIDDELQGSKWWVHTYSSMNYIVYLTKGEHTLELHYYEWTGHARVSFEVNDDNILQQSSPTLTSSSASPASGTTDTTFTFEVVYTDADGAEASYVQVVIDGTSHSMNKTIGEPKTGVLYKYSTTGSNLPKGRSYYYYFRASDGIDTVTSGTYSGPTVTNRVPTLTSGNVSPSSGTTDTIFTYEVMYTDADGDAPSYVRAYIDGSPHKMNKISGTYAGGAIYRYSTTLGSGSHSYYFRTSDGTDTARRPSSGSSSGPTVTPASTPTPTGDTDGDGMSDTWETQYGLNPNLNDANQDTDGDGYTNLQEYQSGTDPTLASSYPTSSGETTPGGAPPGPPWAIVIVIIVIAMVVATTTTIVIFYMRKK